MRNNHGVYEIPKSRRQGRIASISLVKFITVRRISISVVVASTGVWVWLWTRQQRLVRVETSAINAIAFLADGSKVSAPRNTNATKSSRRAIMQRIVTAYLEPIDRLWLEQTPLPPRNTSASMLKAVTFPQVSCSQDRVEHFPIDEYPAQDPFLPWIHDYFPTQDGSYIQFVAQNRRRCNSGRDHEATMKFWAPQVSLFQPVPVHIVTDESEWNATKRHSPLRYRLGQSPDTASFPETRFICRFHNSRGQEATTFSEFNFNYEFITWRHLIPTMMAITGSDANNIWLSQLLFRCPIPTMFQKDIVQGRHGILDRHNKWTSQLWVDVVPIRTPVRHATFLFTQRHVGPKYAGGQEIFDTKQGWGNHHVLPALPDSGRWANLPICHVPKANAQAKPSLPDRNKESTSATSSKSKLFHLVACTWTAASYTRRGDAVAVSDSARRLREWIVFHLLVGFDHLYIYDNTQKNQQQPSPLLSIAMDYPDHVTYHPWPCKVCNNNRPNHPNSGERSSQYAAEASCRERYGPMTEWMSFIDTDEYLVPMTPHSNNDTTSIPTWHDLLHSMEANKTQILKLRSSRSKPRYELMEVQEDQSTCVDPRRPHATVDPCIGPRQNETFLRVYNCEFIKPPRPSRFDRAMKQIYRPDFVLSHFVHYATVTADTARYYADHPADGSTFTRNINGMSWVANAPEVFLDERTQGTLIHTRSVLPHETMRRSNECVLDSKHNCVLGYPCPDSVELVDGQYQKNAFRDEAGKYCNCWANQRIETLLIPLLEAGLRLNNRLPP